MPAISTATLSFLHDLALNNNRDWFQSNRDRFNKAAANFETFVFSLIAGISEFDKGLGAVDPRECIFRIYRDVRFSTNKLPYKENFGAYIAPSGRKSSMSGYYIHIQPGVSFASGGLYMAPAPVMKAVRQAMVDSRNEFLDIVNNTKFVSLLTFDGVEQTKRVPLDFPADETLSPYLRLKHITPSHYISDRDILKSNFESQVLEVFRAMYPLISFINQAII